MITQASQVSILVKDLEAAKQFYTKKLGFIVRDEIEFSPGWKYLTVSPSSANETRLELVKADTPGQEAIIGRQAANQVLIMFLSDDIEKDYLEMKDRGVTFHGEPKNVPGGKGVGFEDLYGNAFDLFQPISKER
ncbi:VOC family protein [Cytobacillus purgationiresistens]|uniref:Enzyme related to lactoylglutathione lyase n=1 Tax=Cytobacillus purgationiresistens TaxID=863449 RepID=A0ABU0ALX7_9BACI|nr:VOC family protein [Cytobacillus purgationiresistens]MDQ0271746.1 putative enzyme related to lactoylglutathione lyase [Cytobacillus purgationiresistens]